MFPFTIPQIILAVVLYIIYYIFKDVNCWKKRVLPQTPFVPVLGNCGPLLSGEKTVEDITDEVSLIARKSDMHAAGSWFFNKPFGVVRSCDFIQKMLGKQFNLYSERVRYSFDDQHFHYGLLQAKQPEWRKLRDAVAPSFTMEKLESLFDKIKGNGDNLAESIKKSGCDSIDILDVCTRYADDNMAVCYLNQKGHKLNEIKTTKHYNNGREYSLKEKIEMITIFTVPETFVKFWQELLNGNAIRTVLGISKDTSKSQEATVDVILSSFKNTSEAVGECISWILYHLASDIKLQESVRKEILDVKSKNNGTISHKSLGDMPYLDILCKETLRLHPIVRQLDRKSTKNNRLGGGLFMAKGDNLCVSLKGLHTDPQYWEEPENFNPKRFIPFDENKELTAYLPFGNGPRRCLGEQFAVLQAKIGVISILSKYKSVSISGLFNEKKISDLKLKLV